MRNSFSVQVDGKEKCVLAVNNYNEGEIEEILFILNSYYGTPEKAKEMIEKGNSRELKSKLEDSVFFDGEMNIPRKYVDLTALSRKEYADYFYHFNGDHWGIIG